MNEKIPKKIHYIWFGKGEKSPLIQECMENSKKYLDGWEIIEWTEDTYDIRSCPYAYEAYKHKKYAFASDYARFDILYQYGGVYIDTDVELLKTIPENMLNDHGFAGMENDANIASGLIFACVPGDPIVKEILEVYRAEHFELSNGDLNMKTVVSRVTEVFKRHGYQNREEEQIVDGFRIYPNDYFCAYDFVAREFHITDRTISVHRYAGTWAGFGGKLSRGIMDVLRKILGKKIYVKLIGMKRRILGVRKPR